VENGIRKHRDTGQIILINISRRSLGVTNVSKNRTKVENFQIADCGKRVVFGIYFENYFENYFSVLVPVRSQLVQKGK
jgi:hypothetical protein